MLSKFFYRLIIAINVILLVSCNSHSVNDQMRYKKQFGAKYQGRHYIAAGQEFKLVDQISEQKKIINSGGFLQQFLMIENRSPRMLARFNSTYDKVLKWVLAGGSVNEINTYGLQPKLMRGGDGFQNVMFTGYYSPVIDARSTPQGEFIYPIHRLPKQRRVSRSEIYAGALKNQGLEIAYTKSLLDNFLLGVQGSGYLDFGDGNPKYFAYAGQNGFGYVSIGKLLIDDGEIERSKMSMQAIQEWAVQNPTKLQPLLERNPSYIYFKYDEKGETVGAAGIPLIPLAAVAADRNIIPSGSILLVEEPLIDDQGQWTGEHQFRLMVALDVGGAVKGHHLDLYQGIGKEAGHRAGLLKHYGRVWVLQ